MKDFKKPELYESEQGRFEHIRKNRIETNTEYNQTTKYESGQEEEEDMATEFMGSAFEGLDSFGGLDSIDSGGFGDFGNFGVSNTGADESWRQGKPLYEQFLYSLPMLCKYVFEQMSDGKNTKEEWKNVMKPLQIFGAGLFIVSLLAKVVGFNTPHIPLLGIFVGLTVVAACIIIDYQVYKSGPIAKFKGEVPDETEESPADDTSDPFNLGGLSDNEDGGMDFFNMGDDDTFGSQNLAFGESTMENKLEFNEEAPYESDEDDEEDADDLLAPSDINIMDDEDFKLGLLEQFKKNAKYQGRYIPERKKLLDSFAGMLVTNDKKFSKWVTEKEHSVTYDNIGYTIYKALIDISKGFAKAEGSESKITIVNITSSPLMYKIELRLPSKYFKPSAVEKSVGVFENYMKIDASDTEVQCLISTSSDLYTFRFLRLDYSGLISIGDILRYRDSSGQTPYQKFINPKLGAPILVGLRDSEYPHVVDLEKNTAMAIVGGSGSGKSWLTYELGVNLAMANDFNEINFIVLDAKNSTFWKVFARMPHVLGYHHDETKYLDIAREVEAEMNRRQVMLGEYGLEDFVEARKKFKKKGDYEKLKEFPLLVFVIDEITSTMNTLEGLDDKGEIQKAFIASIANISQKGRSAGVRLLTIGQRSINSSLPKNVRANSSMLFGMKMDASSDFGILFDGSKEVENMKKPTNAGLGIIKSNDVLGYHNLKTLTPGGQDEEQIRMFLRIMAVDWVRRAAGREDLYKKPINTQYEISYNRPMFLDETYTELALGSIFGERDDDKNLISIPGYETDLLNEATNFNNAQRKNENTFTSEQRSVIVEQHKKEPKIAEPVFEQPKIVEPVFEEVFEDNNYSDEEYTENVELPVKKQIQFPDLTDFINNLNLEEDEDIDEEDVDEDFSFEDDDSYQDDLFNAKKELFAKQKEKSLVEDEHIKKFDAPNEPEPHVENIAVNVKSNAEPDLEDFEEDVLESEEPELYETEAIEEPVMQEEEIVEEQNNYFIEDEPDNEDSDNTEPDNEDSDNDDSDNDDFDTDNADSDGINPFGDLFDEEEAEDEAEESTIEEVVYEPAIEKPKVFEKVVPKAPVIKKTAVAEKPKPIINQKPKVQAPIVKKEPIQKPVEREVVKQEPIVKAPPIQQPKRVTPSKPQDSYNTGVKMHFNTPSAQKKETPNISIQQYIVENGVKVGSFDSAIPKEVLDNVYTKNQINKAIRAMEIMSTKDSYLTSI